MKMKRLLVCLFVFGAVLVFVGSSYATPLNITKPNDMTFNKKNKKLEGYFLVNDLLEDVCLIINAANPSNDAKADIFINGKKIVSKWDVCSANNEVYSFITLAPKKGKIDFKLQCKAGEFTFQNAELKSANVPNPSTFWLFGSGMICLLGLKRKVMK
jgi:hypothetical protein